MKRFTLLIAALAGMLVSATACSDQVTLTKLWETPATMTTAESVIFDSQRKVLYVACINGEIEADNRQGFISKVDLQGNILTHKWVDRLNAPKGMGIHEGRLYVTELHGVVEIDLETASIVRRYPVKHSKLLNDIHIAADGTVYFSDHPANTIYRLKQGEIERFARHETLNEPNGLLVEQDRLLVASMGAHQLQAVDLHTRKITVLAEALGHSDGLEHDGNGGYLVSNWDGEVYHLDARLKATRILDTREEAINAADIEYIAEQNLLLVPTFFDNRLFAYRLVTDATQSAP